MRKYAIFLAFLLIFSGSGDCGKEAMEKPIFEKIREYRSLFQEKTSRGLDTSNAEMLNGRSIEAAERGDRQLAENLLGEAIAELKGLGEGYGGPKAEKRTVAGPVRTVHLNITSASAIITTGMPALQKGADVKDPKTVFEAKTVQARDGYIEIRVGHVPVFIEENTSGKKAIRSESPFGFHPAHTAKMVKQSSSKGLIPPSELLYDYTSALDIGVKWNRPDYYALWNLIQKTDEDLGKNIYNWKENDCVYGSVPPGISIMANIGGIQKRTVRGSEPNPRVYSFKSAYFEEKYIEFVKRTVERYDGDGKDDMPGLRNPVKYWQVLNEPDVASNDTDGYAHLVEITSRAVKESCGDCKVVMGGVALGEKGIKDFYIPVLKKLGGRYVDVFDLHHFGLEGEWKKLSRLMELIKEGLDCNGFKDTEVWITETGTYTDSPREHGRDLPSQTEAQQASGLVKRYVYALSLGAKKVFWAFGMIEGFNYDRGFWDFTGLIQNVAFGRDRVTGTKKLAYYSYKLMTEKIDGSDLSSIRKLDIGEGIYVFKFERPDRTVYVLWTE